MSFSENRAILIQVLHDRDNIPVSKLQRFSRKGFWAYRAIAAGSLTGKQLDELIEREKDIRVARQLAWNPDATAEQLNRIFELWELDTAKEDFYHNEVAYAVANHENCSLILREKLKAFLQDWTYGVSQLPPIELVEFLEVTQKLTKDELLMLSTPELIKRVKATNGSSL